MNFVRIDKRLLSMDTNEITYNSSKFDFIVVVWLIQIEFFPSFYLSLLSLIFEAHIKIVV